MRQTHFFLIIILTRAPRNYDEVKNEVQKIVCLFRQNEKHRTASLRRFNALSVCGLSAGIYFSRMRAGL